MLLNKKLDFIRLRDAKNLPRFSILCAFVSISLLTSCTTTHIPGLDQILFPNSSAKVGPVLTADEQPELDVKETTVADDPSPKVVS